MSDVFCETKKISYVNFNYVTENISDIKLYRIKLSSYYDLIPELTKYLNVAELQRARNYHFEKDTNQFIICRSLLKFILAQHTSLPMAKINIEIDTNKKPYLSSNESVCFNLSHATDYAVFLVRNDNAVGIDIEYLNIDFDFSEILPDIFNDLEIEAVLKANNKVQEFYKFWTRKEAIVKATGTGISDFLTQIPTVDGHHFVNAKLLNGYKKLQVFSFNMEENYIASIALSGEKLDFDKLLIYNLPSSIDELLSFCS